VDTGSDVAEASPDGGAIDMVEDVNYDIRSDVADASVLLSILRPYQASEMHYKSGMGPHRFS